MNRLVPKSLTLNDLERHNSPNLCICIILPNSVALGTDYVKVVADTPILSAAEMYGQIIQFLVTYHLRRYWQGTTPSKSVKMRLSPLASENLTITCKRVARWEGKLVLITNRKSYMSFGQVLKSVTLNDLERHNGSQITLRYFNEFGKRAFQLITASSSIERSKVGLCNTQSGEVSVRN